MIPDADKTGIAPGLAQRPTESILAVAEVVQRQYGNSTECLAHECTASLTTPASYRPAAEPDRAHCPLTMTRTTGSVPEGRRNHASATAAETVPTSRTAADTDSFVADDLACIATDRNVDHHLRILLHAAGQRRQRLTGAGHDFQHLQCAGQYRSQSSLCPGTGYDPRPSPPSTQPLLRRRS